MPVCTKKCIKEYRRRRKKRKSDSTDNNTVAPLDVSDDAVITFFDTKNEDIPYLKVGSSFHLLSD